MLLIPAASRGNRPAATRPRMRCNSSPADFWEWRAGEQPFSFDDIPRLDRPAGMGGGLVALDGGKAPR